METTMEVLKTLVPVMLVVRVSIEVALRERAKEVGEQAVPLDTEGLNDEEVALLTRRLARAHKEILGQARYVLLDRNNSTAPLAMPTAKINPETVTAALKAWVTKELAYEASLAAAIVEASERGTLDEMIACSTHYPTSTDVGTIGFKVGSAAWYLSTLFDSHEALKLMGPAIDLAREMERARAKASYLGRSLTDLIVYQNRHRCLLMPGVVDADTQAHRAAAEKHLAEIIEREVRAEAESEAKKARAEEAKKARAEALRQYVIDNAPDFADGAREGYDIAAGAVSHVAEIVRSMHPENAEIVARGSGRYEMLRFEVATSPRRKAMTLRGAVEATIERLRETGKIPANDIVAVDVMPVQRVTDHNLPQSRRAVVVDVSVGGVHRLVIFPAE
jgi:hypothetical protein